MWPFLLGLMGWIALLFWGWIQVGRSLGDPVRSEATAKEQSAVGTRPSAVEQRDTDDVIPTILHD
jgi:hypothetical protein